MKNPSFSLLNLGLTLNGSKKILTIYNGTSIYNHAVVRHTVELDACLMGYGSVSGNYVYHLKIDRGYGNLNIVHLEMLNILLAFRAFASHWTMKSFNQM